MHRYAGVLARDPLGRVALVREDDEHHDGSTWNPPSGQVESDETPEQGAVRELAEESGLVITPGNLSIIATSEVRIGSEPASRSWNYAADVTGELAPADPDGSVVEARWFDLDAALVELARIPYAPIREPLCAYLRGEVRRGVHWTFALPSQDAGWNSFTWSNDLDD